MMTTTAVFVHGVPETPAIWKPLLKALEWPDLRFLSPPGFGAPLPGGFGATVDDYRRWLIGELERFDRLVHLVGHDWGGAHVLNVAMTRPDLIRSWAADTAGIFDPEYVWHDLARTWQTEGEGEQAVERMTGAPLDDRTAFLESRGIPSPVARELAGAQNEAMGRAILSLYRSATQPAMAKLGENLPLAARRPGLCFLATEDHAVGSPTLRRRSAHRAGASIVVLDGQSHWWPTAPSAPAATSLMSFWRSIS